jgi:hypothetical protein
MKEVKNINDLDKMITKANKIFKEKSFQLKDRTNRKLKIKVKKYIKKVENVSNDDML